MLFVMRLPLWLNPSSFPFGEPWRPWRLGEIPMEFSAKGTMMGRDDVGQGWIAEPELR